MAAPWRLPFDAWLQQIEQLRVLAAALFDGDADALAMVPSAAHGLATVARNLPLDRRDAVLVLEGQFPSNVLIWQRRCAEAGAHLVAVPTDTEDSLTDAVLQTIAETPVLRVASLPHAYWLDGRVLDLDRISAAVHARGAALALDLSQSLGVLPPDLSALATGFRGQRRAQMVARADGIGVALGGTAVAHRRGADRRTLDRPRCRQYLGISDCRRAAVSRRCTAIRCRWGCRPVADRDGDDGVAADHCMAAGAHRSCLGRVDHALGHGLAGA